jgi:glycosyltransferase involved in cell wall biosynthesis
MTAILHVTECYSGGVEHVINALVDATPQHEHHLLFANAGGRSLAAIGRWSSLQELPEGLPARVAAVGRTVRDNGFDVLHAHSSWAGVYARARRLPVPVVYQPHCFAFEAGSHSRWRRSVFRGVERALASRTRTIIAVSPRELRLATGLRAGTDVELIRNVATVRPEPTSSRPAAAPPTVAMVGRLCEQKNPAAFIQVAQAVRQRLPSVRFRWIGDGETGWRRALSDADVEVTGWLGTEDLRRELLQATVYYHCARYEGFPVGVLDASALGLPLVLPDIAAFEGLVLPLFASPEAIVDEIVRLCSDPAAQAAAASRSRSIYDELTSPSMADSAAALYERLVPSAERVPAHSGVGAQSW